MLACHPAGGQAIEAPLHSRGIEMRRLIGPVAGIAGSLVAMHAALAWGPQGHRIVALIADKQLQLGGGLFFDIAYNPNDLTFVTRKN